MSNNVTRPALATGGSAKVGQIGKVGRTKSSVGRAGSQYNLPSNPKRGYVRVSWTEREFERAYPKYQKQKSLEQQKRYAKVSWTEEEFRQACIIQHLQKCFFRETRASFVK